MLLPLCALAAAAGAAAPLPVEVHPERAVSVNGHTQVQRKLFGLTAYEGATIPVLPDQREWLRQAGITCLGFPGVIGWCAPEQPPADRAALQQWYASDEAAQMIRDRPLNGDRYMYGRLLPACRELGVEPMVYLLGGPAWAMGPESIPNDADEYAELVCAYVGLLRRFDPELRLFHLDNEPNARWFKANQGGPEYAQLFVTVARELHARFPDARIGGPVLCWPPAWPPSQEGQANWYTWDQWTMPLIEAAGDELDFFDFHLYNFALDQALEEITLLANTLRLQRGREVPILITESNLALSEAAWRTPAQHFALRTLPWERYLLALLEHPDQVESLQMHDLSAIAGDWWCRFLNWDDPVAQTPTFWLYRLMRHLRGTRVEVTHEGPLDAFATRDGRQAACLVLNDTDQAAEVAVSFAGRPEGAQLTWERIYLAPDGTFVHDEGVVPEPSGASTVPVPPRGTVVLTTELPGMPEPAVGAELAELYGDRVMNEIGAPGDTVTITVNVPGEALAGAERAEARLGLLGSEADDRMRLTLAGAEYEVPTGTYYAVIPLRRLPSAGPNELRFTLDERPREHRLRVSCATLAVWGRHP